MNTYPCVLQTITQSFLKICLSVTQCVSYGRHIDNTHSYLLHRHGSDMVIPKQDSFKDSMYAW